MNTTGAQSTQKIVKMSQLPIYISDRVIVLPTLLQCTMYVAENVDLLRNGSAHQNGFLILILFRSEVVARMSFAILQ